MSVLLLINILGQAGEEAEGSEVVLEAAVEFFNLVVALIALYFAIRILPSISHDVRKRSWFFMSLAAITFALAEIIGVLKEFGRIELEGIYEVTEALFVTMLAVGFYYMYTREHAETLKLKHQSTTDDLTSLYTHGFFQTYLMNKVKGLKYEERDLSVLFADIDDFKQYNDKYGHQEGDYVLRSVAQAITREARGEDIASRYGGEEFTLIMGCDFETACQIAERLRAGVEERCSRFADPNIKANVTVSIGLASFGRDGDSAEKLVQIADARMYKAKSLGKNQVYTGFVRLEDFCHEEADQQAADTGRCQFQGRPGDAVT